MKAQVDHAKEQAKLQYASIAEMVAVYKQAETDDSDEAMEEARERIQEDPLCISVRSDWYDPGTSQASDKSPCEYTVLLCTGGPACRVIGRLDENGYPKSACIEYQDWGTPWTDYPLSSEQEAIVLEYAQQFYYGE